MILKYTPDRLVLNAMKLQICRPSFFDSRDAIIQADQVLTGGENYCLLWEGFASRGLGPDAKVEGRTPWGGGIRTNVRCPPVLFSLWVLTMSGLAGLYRPSRMSVVDSGLVCLCDGVYLFRQRSDMHILIPCRLGGLYYYYSPFSWIYRSCICRSAHCVYFALY